MRKFALIVLTFAVLAPTSRAGTNSWSALGADLSWSTAGNWSPSGPPGPNDEARFFNPGAVADTTVDIVVSASTNVQRLWFGQTNGPNQNMTINSGVTLTVAGTNDNGYGPLGSDPDAGGITPDPVPARYLSTIYVGTKTTNSSTQIVKANISGQGTLVVNNTNNEILMRQFYPTGGPTAPSSTCPAWTILWPI